MLIASQFNAAIAITMIGDLDTSRLGVNFEILQKLGRDKLTIQAC